MKFLGLVVTAVVAAALPLNPGGGPLPGQSPPATSPGITLRTNAPEPPIAPVEVGESAPNFTFPGADGRSLALSDLTAQGHVLIVFATSEPMLASIEKERDELLDMGVLPVAIVPERPGAAKAEAQRLGLRYPLVSDSRRVVASQYNLVDESGPRILPGYFVVDRRRRVRAAIRGTAPAQSWARVTASALALPRKDAPLPAQSR